MTAGIQAARRRATRRSGAAERPPAARLDSGAAMRLDSGAATRVQGAGEARARRGAVSLARVRALAPGTRALAVGAAQRIARASGSVHCSSCVRMAARKRRPRAHGWRERLRDAPGSRRAPPPALLKALHALAPPPLVAASCCARTCTLAVRPAVIRAAARQPAPRGLAAPAPWRAAAPSRCCARWRSRCWPGRPLRSRSSSSRARRVRLDAGPPARRTRSCTRREPSLPLRIVLTQRGTCRAQTECVHARLTVDNLRPGARPHGDALATHPLRKPFVAYRARSSPCHGAGGRH